MYLSHVNIMSIFPDLFWTHPSGSPQELESFFSIPDIYDLITFWICNSYGIPIVLLEHDKFNHFIASKTGVTAIPVITLEIRF